MLEIYDFLEIIRTNANPVGDKASAERLSKAPLDSSPKTRRRDPN